MDNFVDERDFKLLEKDRYTFFVLRRILDTECRLILSDHEKIILCHSSEPHPVWIWTEDNAPEDVMAAAFKLAEENGFLDGGHTLNMKYDLADYFIRKSAEKATDKNGTNAEIKKLSITINMMAYDCPNPIPPAPSEIADGEIYQCQKEDVDELVTIMQQFQKQTGTAELSIEEYRYRSEEVIKKGTMFFWKNAEGKNVASCTFGPIGKLASLGLVYTYPEYRRRHYAQNLVYVVTKIVEKAGYLPMLYTDADYVASNACYEKIGYILRGKLCTIGVK